MVSVAVFALFAEKKSAARDLGRSGKKLDPHGERLVSPPTRHVCLRLLGSGEGWGNHMALTLSCLFNSAH